MVTPLLRITSMRSQLSERVSGLTNRKPKTKNQTTAIWPSLNLASKSSKSKGENPNFKKFAWLRARKQAIFLDLKSPKPLKINGNSNVILTRQMRQALENDQANTERYPQIWYMFLISKCDIQVCTLFPRSTKILIKHFEVAKRTAAVGKRRGFLELSLIHAFWKSNGGPSSSFEPWPKREFVVFFGFFSWTRTISKRDNRLISRWFCIVSKQCIVEMRNTCQWVLELSGAGTSPPGVPVFFQNKHALLCFGCGLDDGGGCCRSWDPSSLGMLPSSLSILTYEAERTLDSPTRSRQGLPLVVNDVSCGFFRRDRGGHRCS